MMLAFGAGITLTTLTEAAIAAHHRDGLQVLYAAEAGIDLAAKRLRERADWAATIEEGGGRPLLEGRFADLVADGEVDPRMTVTVTAGLDPNNPDVVILQSTARLADGLRRSVQATIRR